MLVLKRKVGEVIQIGHDIAITLVRCEDGGARIGIDAPNDVAVHRREIYDAIHGITRTIPAASVTSEHRKTLPNITNGKES